MPVEYKFFTDPALTFLRYHGHIHVDELIIAAKRYAKEPQAGKPQPHLFDLSRVTSYDFDFTKLATFMAQLADIYPTSGGEQLFVFFAPPGKPAEMAEFARRPWEGSSTILIRVVQTSEQAFDILGGTRSDVINHMKTLA